MADKLSLSKKQHVITRLFLHCKERNDWEFDNELVKEISLEVGFKNAFDVTKVDNADILPPILKEHDMFISHKGSGKHCFIPNIDRAYHRFEKINTIRDWDYKKSLLNEYDTSESNILSVAYNQFVIHDFLYEDRRAYPNVYNAKRTQCSYSYYIGEHKITMDRIQMEIDQTLEYENQVTVCEGKNKFPERFAVYQIYHPFLYYYELQQNEQLNIKKINCCYLLRDRKDTGSTLRFYLYTFDEPYHMDSIRLIKSAQYNLTQR